MASPEQPVDFQSVSEAAVGMNELYLSNIGAGFTEAQALWLVGVMLTGNPGPAPDGVSTAEE